MPIATARDFHHPYEPYSIQIEFMSNLYDCLEQGQIGIFESPTGRPPSTHMVRKADSRRHEIEDEPSWVSEHAKSRSISRALLARQEFEARLDRIRQKERQNPSGEPKSKKLVRTLYNFKAVLADARQKLSAVRKSDDTTEEATFALDDYESGDERKKNGQGADGHGHGLSSETIRLLEQAGMVLKDADSDQDALETGTKVFFCSRTHSQLTQFANEVRRVSLPPALAPLSGQTHETVSSTSEGIKLLSLGSRKNLCINHHVSKLSNATAINEKCLELQDPKTPTDKKCQFIPGKESEAIVHEFRDHALADVKDIEDLGRLGKELQTCPYYASRASINFSEIVTLPYPLLLQKSARTALGISLKGHVVIIDEAHNLMNAIEGIYSVGLSLDQLSEARTQLLTYLQKFRNKLMGKNRVYVTQVVRLVDSLIGYLGTKTAASEGGGVIDMTELMTGKGVDQINLHKLCHYLHESKLARKVAGYTAHSRELESKSQIPMSKGNRVESTTPVLMAVESFFHALANPAEEGRFFFERTEGSQCLKYMLLDSSQHFREVVEEARAVVLAGGTMSPMEDYTQHLFPYVPPGKIRTISCGHVIPKENLLAAPISTCDSVELDFTFSKRGSPTTVHALAKTILKLAGIVPHGLVVFFPSYSYLTQVIQMWKRPHNGECTYDKLSAIKRIFSESKDTNVETLFSDYASHISAGSGAVLFAVIGGKLSEGINFSDDLGRCVAVVGLPFPNSQSAEWKTKLAYIEKMALTRGKSTPESKALAKDFYENACMRAVNQSIGRAIRHRGDYASIALLDRRYATVRIQSKLPGWIKDGLLKEAETPRIWQLMQRFYETRLAGS